MPCNNAPEPVAATNFCTSGTEFVIISPQAELEHTEAAMRANLERMAADQGATQATS